MRNLFTLKSLLLMGVAVAALSGPVTAQDVGTAKESILAQQQDNQASQDRINKLDDQAGSIESEYKTVLQQLDSLQVYNNQLKTLLNSQSSEMAALERDILRVTTIDREIVPLMLRMVDAFAQFVALDTPFLKEERLNRVAGLKSLMTRADATPAEKYRRVLEAYQIENEYGRTIEAYAGPLERGGGSANVEFLRLGRVGLFYRTLDDSEVGRWNKDSKAFEAIDAGYLSGIKAGIAVARQQVAPDLVYVPVDAAEASK
ncbi:MAG: DUF3450 domain-containing protein [Alphaproteobacteria bacterium]|nr:DUF3450 domain-containing protein [Alphaproteobacteria bacterium]